MERLRDLTSPGCSRGSFPLYADRVAAPVGVGPGGPG